MTSARFRDRVSIQEMQTERDEDGYETESWQDVFTRIPANVTHMSVKDVKASQSTQHNTMARCEIRYRKGVNSTQRLVHHFDGDDIMYSIDGPPLSDNKNGKKYLTLMISQGVEKWPV